MSCKKYIFLDNNNKLTYIANDKTFDAIYKNIKDPWEQSNINDNFYSDSRKKLSNIIKKLTNNKLSYKILEIGCGNGFSTNCLNNDINNKNILIEGCDISNEAIKQAKNKYKNINFFVHNIKNKFNTKKYDIIIISNLLWYILNDLKLSFIHCFNILNENGKIIFMNAFLKEQRYGRDIIDGFNGFKNFFKHNFPKNKIELEINDYNLDKNDHRYLGLLVIN